MDVFKKHYETLTILGGMAAILVGCCMWINGKFNNVDARFAQIDVRFAQGEKNIDARFAQIEKDITIIKTVLLMKDILPKELAVKKEPPPENKG